MGRTGWPAQPDSLHHRRLRMTGSEPHAPRGTVGRGPNWDRGPGAGHAGAARRCTTRHHRPWAQPGPSAVYGPRRLRVDACASRHRRPRDHSWDRGPYAGRRSCSTRSGETTRRRTALYNAAPSAVGPTGTIGRVRAAEASRRRMRISVPPAARPFLGSRVVRGPEDLLDPERETTLSPAGNV